ncbi:MAG: hypothetical protein ACM3SS_10825 [Rhodospirillaceae bacterium]
MMRRLACVLASCIAFLPAITTAAEPWTDAQDVEYSFAALGDTPYNTDEEQQFIAMLAEMNRSSLAFVVHVGDFKSANAVCTDELYLQRRDWFRLSHHPFIYVPGDNEWTDCWRPFAAGRDPLERLQKLRELFFDTDQSLGQGRLTLARQIDAASPALRYPEHARWVYGRVLYATFNLPGGDNNRTRMPEEAAQRTLAVREWMKSSFAMARDLKLPGVVLFMQANPWRRNGLPRQAFADLLQDLAAEAQSYAGEVLIVHGDTHQFRFGPALADPVTRRPVKNVTRLEVYGSPVVNWVRVEVNVTGSKAKFTITPGSRFGEPLP